MCKITSLYLTEPSKYSIYDLDIFVFLISYIYIIYFSHSNYVCMLILLFICIHYFLLSYSVPLDLGHSLFSLTYLAFITFTCLVPN